MIRLSNTILFLFFLKMTFGGDPQVYENVDDQIQAETNTRVVRDPFKQSKVNLYQPPVFNFQKTVQQDQRKFRYAQQQRADMQNILKRSKLQEPLRVSLLQDVIDPTSSSSIKRENYQLPQEKTNRTSLYSMWNKISQLSTTKKPVISRKLKPSSYYESADGKIKRQDSNHIVYIKNRRSEQDLKALNALVGQPPNNQLEGLKRLLESTQPSLILPAIKGPLPTPIVEHSNDVPNSQTHPNVDQNLSLEALQNQLDENAKAQLAKALADAQQQALAHVEAQHQAIAKAQVEAQKKALAQIALHNQAVKAKPLPQALPLKQEALLKHFPQPEVQVKHFSQPLVQPEVQVKHFSQPSSVPVKQQISATLYAPNHAHREQNELAKVQNNDNLKKINPTKTHSITQEDRKPKAYQQVVLQTQNQDQKVLRQVKQSDLSEIVEDHTYAARYAFGYKIRDAKMGNDFGHEEKRDGENAKGHYHVLLPDGRMQKVEYYAGPSGYHAKVTYENLAHH